MKKNSQPVVWMIWDGAPHWAVQKLLKEGALPYLESILKEGIFAPANPPHLNCQTPPSLATLFTGVSPELHGIYGFNVPDGSMGSCVTKMNSGFDRKILKAKTIWEHAADHGKEYVLVSIPWHRESKGCKFALEAYSNRFARRGTVLLKDVISRDENKGELQIGPYSFNIIKHEKAVEVNYGNSGKSIILLEQSEQAAAWEKHFIDLEPGMGVYMWLAYRYNDNEPLLVYSGIWKTQITSNAMPYDLLSQVGPFNGEGHGSVYRSGMFGTKIVDGGSGYAEDILVRSIKHEAEYFERTSRNAIKNHSDAHLYIFYQPCTDDIGHEFMGLCDPMSKAFDTANSEKIWSHIREVYQAADGHLGTVMECFGDECTVIVSSDHGMAGMNYSIYINEVFKEHGLLDFDSQGNIDLEKTMILYHPANNGSIWVNDIRRPGGIVHQDNHNMLVQKAKNIIEELISPKSGERVVKDIFEPEEGLNIGCLFLGAADGYEFNAGRSSTGSFIENTKKSANHSTNPCRKSLQGIFAAKGPFLNKGVLLEEFDNKSVFPIICKQLDIKTPDDIEGEVPQSAYISTMNFL